MTNTNTQMPAAKPAVSPIPGDAVKHDAAKSSPMPESKTAPAAPAAK